MECFRLLFGHLAWIEHQFLSDIRDSRKAGSLWRMIRGVGGVRKSIGQNWLAKGLGLGLLCWGFKGVQEEIPWEEASTLQIGSGAFPLGQCTSPQLHPCHSLFDQDGHQDSSSPSQCSILSKPVYTHTNIPIHWISYQLYSREWLCHLRAMECPNVHIISSPDLAPCDFWLFPKLKEKLRGCRYETIEAVTKVIDTLTQEDFHGAFQKLLERYKCVAARGDYFEGD